ncbi:MAG TPA: DedA family protein [Solirubrobacterales bacterium]
MPPRVRPRADQPPRRRFLLGLLVVAVVVTVAVVLNRLGGSDGFSLSAGSETLAYLAAAGMVFGDAICPILPGETALNAASTLASEGSLDLVLVMVSGAVGAILGDSALYWIARLGRRRIRPQVEKAERNEKVALALEYMGSSAPVLIVAGRYVPGLRFVVNATMGLSEFPYPRFLVWSALGGVLWAVYTCSLAYLVSTALAGFPLASVIISGVVTTAAIGAVAFYLRRIRRRSEDAVSTSVGVESATIDQ